MNTYTSSGWDFLSFALIMIVQFLIGKELYDEYFFVSFTVLGFIYAQKRYIPNPTPYCNNWTLVMAPGHPNLTAQNALDVAAFQ